METYPGPLIQELSTKNHQSKSHLTPGSSIESHLSSSALWQICILGWDEDLVLEAESRESTGYGGGKTTWLDRGRPQSGQIYFMICSYLIL